MLITEVIQSGRRRVACNLEKNGLEVKQLAVFSGDFSLIIASALDFLIKSINLSSSMNSISGRG